jgi:hypothetical protein
VYIDKHYTPNPNAKAVLIPIAPDIIDVYKPKAVENEFKEDKRGATTMIADSLNVKIKNILADSLQGISFSSINKFDTLQLQIHDDRYFKEITRKIGKDSIVMVFRIPRKNVFDSLDPSNTVYFIITSIKIERNMNAGTPGHWMMNSQPPSDEAYVSNAYSSSFSMVSFGNSGGSISSFTPPPPPSMPMQYMPGTGGSDELSAQIRFAIWDKKLDETVCYGELDVSEGIFLMMTKNTWIHLYESIGCAILKNSPFTHPQGNND